MASSAAAAGPGSVVVVVRIEASMGPSMIVDGDGIRLPAQRAAPAQLVVLNACYSESQAEALRVHVPCVVGMTAKIGDESSRRFAIGLYGGLAHGESVERACAQGCAAIDLDGLADHDQPKLLVRDGVDARKITLT